MTSRDTILQRVRSEVAKGPRVTPPLVPEVWPRENPAAVAMAERFTRELADVQGEVIRCTTMQDARKKLAELIAQAQWGKGDSPRPTFGRCPPERPEGCFAQMGTVPFSPLGAMDRPLVRDAVADLPKDSIKWAAADWQPQPMAKLSASIVEADALLADTGSCLIACPTSQDRLLCYLPPACVVIATTDQLVEHLPAAWATIAPRVADPALRGEFVIVTGPSRTADIEKILILGVHGPQRLVVLLVG